MYVTYLTIYNFFLSKKTLVSSAQLLDIESKVLPYNSKHKLDQFYTKPEVAKELYNIIPTHIPIDDFEIGKCGTQGGTKTTDDDFKFVWVGAGRQKHCVEYDTKLDRFTTKPISPKDGPFKLVYAGLRETQTADLDTNLHYSTLQDINPKPIHKTISVRDIFEAIDWKNYSKKCTGPLYIDKEMIVREYTLKKKELLGY